MTTELNTNLTGPELYVGDNPFARNFLGFRRGWNDPWRDEANRRRAAKFAFGLLGGPAGSMLLSGAYKAKDKLNPNDPFYGPEEKEDPQETRDDYPAVAKERKRLWKLYQRLGRMADLERYKKHVREYG